MILFASSIVTVSSSNARLTSCRRDSNSFTFVFILFVESLNLITINPKIVDRTGTNNDNISFETIGSVNALTQKHCAKEEIVIPTVSVLGVKLVGLNFQLC